MLELEERRDTSIGRDFPTFSKAVAKRFQDISKGELFVVDVTGQALWERYIEAFPQGTNPIFRTNTEHECSCCKNFVRSVGNVVAIADGKLVTVWDIDGLPHPYDVVAAALDELIKVAPIVSIFCTKEKQYGAAHTTELRDNGETHRWHHFVAEIANRHQRTDTERGQRNTTAQVFRRGLEYLSGQSVDDVLDLIADNSLYRGEEHLEAVKEFRRMQSGYQEAEDKALFVWANLDSRAARFRNTVIGTLVQDLSEGVDLDRSVRSFEAKVAPSNYKRPTALITPRMVETAMATIRDLGLEPALERRFARIGDVSVNDVLFVDNSIRPLMRDGIEGALMDAATSKPQKRGTPEPITMTDFMADILPGVTSIDLAVTNGMAPNFVSLTAPVHADAPPLFKWANSFAWSYAGEVADSIKARVKSAGGNVSAANRVSLAWFNTDDLDIHVRSRHGGHIYYGDKRGGCGGLLDVDMNVTQVVRDAVENVCWANPMPDGEYLVSVHNYTKRENVDVGFVLEVERDGRVDTFAFDRVVNGTVKALTLHAERGGIVRIETHAGVVRGSASKDIWGVQTETPVKVHALLASPNHWDGRSTGNKHWIFALDGCLNPEPVRGIYNEFLRPDLDPHRKVFEILGSKTKCDPAPDQLSGVGFSSTRKDVVVAHVSGPKIRKSFEITF